MVTEIPGGVWSGAPIPFTKDMKIDKAAVGRWSTTFAWACGGFS